MAPTSTDTFKVPSSITPAGDWWNLTTKCQNSTYCSPLKSLGKAHKAILPQCVQGLASAAPTRAQCTLHGVDSDEMALCSTTAAITVAPVICTPLNKSGFSFWPQRKEVSGQSSFSWKDAQHIFLCSASRRFPHEPCRKDVAQCGAGIQLCLKGGLTCKTAWWVGPKTILICHRKQKYYRFVMCIN